jgi:DNA-binding transcriptional ArsR family regulator
VSELAELVERVRRIEARLGLDAVAGTSPLPAPEGEVWWLLQELERRGLDATVVYAGRLDGRDGPVQWQITESADRLLETEWSAAAAPLAALGHPSRLQILQLVAQGRARTATELAGTEGLGTTGQIYHHLRQLVATGWLRPTDHGRHEVPAGRLVPLLVLLSAAGAAG